MQRALAIVLALFLMPTISLALPEEGQKAEKKKEFPQAGTLSSTMRGGYNKTTANIPVGMLDEREGTPPDIGGSVSQVSPREWVMRLVNHSKNPYSVDVKVVQLNERGATLKTDHFSYRLSAGEKVERFVSSSLNTKDCRLEMTSAKALVKAPAKVMPPAATPKK